MFVTNGESSHSYTTIEVHILEASIHFPECKLSFEYIEWIILDEIPSIFARKRELSPTPVNWVTKLSRQFRLYVSNSR